MKNLKHRNSNRGVEGGGGGGGCGEEEAGRRESPTPFVKSLLAASVP